MDDTSHEHWLWGRWSAFALGAASATAIADQAHKWYMIGAYDLPAKGRVYVTPFMDFVFHKNTGISYSLLDGDSYRWQLALAAFSAVVCAGMWVWVARAGNRLIASSLALIIGGAVGNAVDRIVHGGVVDYVSLHALGYYWYVFNIADCAIVAGVAGLLYDSIKRES